MGRAHDKEAEPPYDDAGGRLADLLDRLARVARGMQFAAGLNPAQWEALRFVARANRQSRTPGALAAYLCVTKGTASQTLKSLTDKGYVESCRDGDDGRVRTLAISPAGQDLLSRDPLMALAAAAGTLDAGHCNTITNTLETLLQDVQQAQGWRAFGACTQCGHFGRECASDDGKPHLCGLTGDGLDSQDIRRLCVNFQA
ncbi:MAG: MarR family winged helix-turn-helix transcriptional regulator [Alphaproteobacteria bacterium]